MTPRKHLVIPDTQITPSSPLDHLGWIGQYIVEKQPDVIVQLGDFADMESLSSYDKGKKQYEGRRYKKDIDAAKKGMAVLLAPLRELQKRQRKNKEKVYKPELHLTLGNHEFRIQRAVDDDAKLDGFMSIDDLQYKEAGWLVHPFLEPVEIDGIFYCHYFYQKMSGRPYSGDSIDTRLKNLGFSFCAGHEQRYLVGVRSLNNGKRIRGMVHGAAYLHDEEYRGPQGNSEPRGVVLLNEVRRGDYRICEVSFDFLCKKYENMILCEYMKINYQDIFNNSLWLKNQDAA